MKNFVLSIAATSLLLTGCSESKKEESEKDPAAQEAATPEKNTSDQKENAMYKELSSYIQSAEAEMEAIASERNQVKVLKPLFTQLQIDLSQVRESYITAVKYANGHG